MMRTLSDLKPLLDPLRAVLVPLSNLCGTFDGDEITLEAGRALRHYGALTSATHLGERVSPVPRRFIARLGRDAPRAAIDLRVEFVRSIRKVVELPSSLRAQLRLSIALLKITLDSEAPRLGRFGCH